jgi:hypothetical protein
VSDDALAAARAHQRRVDRELAEIVQHALGVASFAGDCGVDIAAAHRVDRGRRDVVGEQLERAASRHAATLRACAASF